jgi:DnaJ-class molecular chaperone
MRKHKTVRATAIPTTITCPSCNGDGILQSYPDLIEFSDKVYEEPARYYQCTRCKGNGFIYAQDQASYS